MTSGNFKIKLLRICSSSTNISADVFDNLFRENIGSLFSTEYISSMEFVSLVSKKSGLFELLNKYDYICPDYKMMAVVPWFMQLRNHNNLSFGIVFITHSPGIYGLEWYLMQNLICNKDIIIAPSNFSGRVITLLAPSLKSNLEIINHPINLKSNHNKTQNRGNKIVTLSRIVDNKLIHRQIDAMGLIVHKYGYDHLKMFIGGNLNDSESGELTHYARLLYLKIKLLKLEQNVFLTGEISAPGKKAFFMDSFVSVNLSRTLEEAFPKVSVEALSFGIPVVSTLWNGFRETVGSAGILLDLEIDSNGRADVDSDDLARAIIRLYEEPVYEDICHNQIKKYDFSALKKKYIDIISDRVSRDTAPTMVNKEYFGLLDTISFLKVFTHSELMKYHTEWVENYFKAIRSNNSETLQTGEVFFRYFVSEALNQILTGFYSFKYSEDILYDFKPIKALSESGAVADFREKMRQSIYISNNSHSKKTLLRIFSERPDQELLKEAILHFKSTEEDIPLMEYFIHYADYLDEKYSEVCTFYNKYYRSLRPDLSQAENMCLWSRAAMKCNDTKGAIEYLGKWLKRYITEPEASKIHIEYMKLLLNTPGIPRKTIDQQLENINEISFDRKLFKKLEIAAYVR
ncbi:glycosyltransferase [Desulforegula conservatrix]|uniref:glycosyltransferase n=1 Tax=Desulforegula conservatrix TaxID=153026 RepID=UPI000407E9E9|nr:glycosyltransferase [Desulforegula conservatrix]